MTTLLDKLWDAHEILRSEEGRSLLWVDRHLVHEGSHHAFAKLAARGARVAEPNLTFGVVDHYAPTRGAAASPAIARMIKTLENNAAAHGVTCFGLKDPRQGIVHVVGPEQGLTLPGLLINCGDSHTSTHGAFGALAFGIGATEVAHVLATQTIWQSKPKSMRITVTGKMALGVGAKDLALAWIAKLGTGGAQGHAVEYAGDAVRTLSMEGRMTLCNLSIEGGARFGIIAPDDTTLDYIQNRPYAPKGAAFDKAVSYWKTLQSDSHAEFDRDVSIDATDIAPIVTWGTSPEDALPVTAKVPSPSAVPDAEAERVTAAIDYMGLTPGRALTEVQIDQVFIGSCTNARIEDLRAAAAVLAGRRAKVPGLVSPGSQQIKSQAEAEGLDRIFTDAGLEWARSGCSMCVAMNGDSVGPGKRCASTTNRNFRGRQGRGARTHLMSPAMVAAAAVTGHLTDVRPMLKGRDAA
ncbi:3-isopropylmalate dehydratase large subunit [Roseobacter sp. HKCCD9010]|uniref:3-isopropylmalate dehydratase large subunit n=1 Tax=unclassified Roseobacter TaxID=196798 RepID=UPI001492C3EB|nr:MULTISPECIES: 3-isopropylmalate dehydratase large subunit [unclassified Roseobacter]MBF9052082.1 3-isopropylmalate dehydratase large subunit [Rhodobacterales bacterium HKCCD4356]NNV14004.1 3-isopropylmalate dehydratase large subunit [Roseobacter sp. HKCCD7357]NNV18245.1 3-isopropylmalate dehydratase large subunit [Roseobacter sp. HKCCD8768]NNV27703.1 3-isopropylmalate dehydratase large subunit [Roseobacter sp. HKCCD8192]NNV31946.1 3-isopropylmalate dehydratase large subunit [Roseobacter sp.